MLPVRIAVAGRERTLAQVDSPLEPGPLLELDAPRSDWEVEIGFGKGKFLLEQARENPARGYLGIEVASQYYRRVRDRAARDRLENLVVMRGEARFLLAAVLPAGFARRVHVYFPDPWPKSRHHARRLFEPESLDLVLRLLQPSGTLLFATDYLEYGGFVGRLLRSHPGLKVREPVGSWDGRARTHYEAKYQLEGRAILRFEAQLTSGEHLLHPLAGRAVLAATSRPIEGEDVGS